MKRLNKNETIAVVVGLLTIVGFFLWSPAMNFLAGAAQVQQQEAATDRSESGPVVEVRDVRNGTGPRAQMGDTVTVHYVGHLENGRMIDNSRERGQPFTFTLGQQRVIPGWEQGITGMREGGMRELTIPPELAYGDRSIGPIPANATLEFTVEMLEVEKQ